MIRGKEERMIQFAAWITLRLEVTDLKKVFGRAARINSSALMEEKNFLANLELSNP
jgi:hypothetical protein